MILHTLLFSLFFSFYTTVSPEVYVGKWEISSGSVISIYQKDNIFFGKVLKRSNFPLFNKNGLDNKNPNPELRTHTIVGSLIMNNMSYTDGILTGGTIYNADSGKSYPVILSIYNDNTDLCHIKIEHSFFARKFKAKRIQ